MSAMRLLHPDERTLVRAVDRSVRCHKRASLTHCDVSFYDLEVAGEALAVHVKRKEDGVFSVLLGLRLIGDLAAVSR